MSDIMGQVVGGALIRWRRRFRDRSGITEMWCWVDRDREVSLVCAKAEGGGKGGRYSVTSVVDEVSRWELEDGRLHHFRAWT